jgi:hypothetical protein
MAELRLEVREFESLARWRWVLTRSDGGLLADYEVRLDTASWQFEAFTDLPECLRWRVAPDKRVEDEGRILAEVGDWIGVQVLGRVGPAMVRARTATSVSSCRLSRKRRGRCCISRWSWDMSAANRWPCRT